MQSDEASPTVQEWRAHWRVALVAMLGVMLCSIHGYTLGVMIAPLEEEFGWSRASITGGLLIIACIAVFGGPLAGRAADRFGPRRVVLFGIPLFCLAYGMLALATSNIWTWWALWVLLAAGNMCILPTIWAAALNTLFDASRGKALAVAMCGTGLATFFLPAAATWLYLEYGWRTAYVVVALAGFAVVFPLALMWFRGAGDAGPRKRDRAAPPAPIPGPSASEQFRSARFLKLLAASTFFSITICALTTNGVPVLRANGFDPIEAAYVFGFMGVGSIVGRLLGGVLLDIADAKKVAAASVMAPVVTALMLLYAGDSQPVAMLAMLILGLAIGTEVDCCAYLAGRHLGLKNFGALFGLINGTMLLGNGIAPFAANYIYDLTKSYDPVLWAQLPACIASAVLFLMLGKYPGEEAKADGSVAPVPA